VREDEEEEEEKEDEDDPTWSGEDKGSKDYVRWVDRAGIVHFPPVRVKRQLALNYVIQGS